MHTDMYDIHLHFSIRYVSEIRYLDICLKYICIELKWYHYNTAYLRSQ